ncbi:exonuclease sbcCD subunit D, partial [Chryseobacterium phosphatilyticum]
IEERELTPKQDMREVEGYMEELLDPNFYTMQKVDDYLKITLFDEGAIMDPINKLRQIYPNILHLERKIDRVDLKERKSFSSAGKQSKTELSLFEDFYHDMTTADFSEEKRNMMISIIDKVKGVKEPI